MDFKSASRTLLLALAGSTLALSAAAQWQWIDKDGRKVFSDRAPPAEVAEKNILKQPGARTSAAAAEPETATAAPAISAAGKASAPRLTGKDAQLETKKKQADYEAQVQKKEEEEKLANARADNCERARKGLATMQSGIRLSVTNAQGEREFMDDKARAAEAKRLQGIADSDCKK